MTEEITFSTDGYVATIALNRPQKLNAVTPEMASALIAAVERCNADDDIRCVVLTGAGPKAFCCGSDIRELDRYDTAWNFRNREDYCDAIRRLRKPSIAAVNGYAFGGGLETAMSCDVRICSDNAQFAAPEIKLGWIGGGGVAAFLSHAIGASNAALMILTGDPIDAAKALAWGLVSEVVPQEGLLDRAHAIAAVIASRAPIAAETAKLNLAAAHALPVEQAIAYERDLQTICFATADAAEGRAAFKEKRQPVFRRK
ncbi:enoyl-CoA hydratase/isomerase family protein [Xanthobacter dioxanivorans]|uniref:Enoyl-CoA hydratase/isomerase family protein n=1 Tax=Xanthobacter dioxanivorans TaxID=2528964 RepID=A0A974PNA0_9HYPH|nr:enoyl-CoA hydratase/isomerase family protein [Xanthobacter dioxanivorans]QRG06334.1 enoyl-CoA hydratase/isomerase family protein [Xanthobacter dioxanivorans]